MCKKFFAYFLICSILALGVPLDPVHADDANPIKKSSPSIVRYDDRDINSVPVDSVVYQATNTQMNGDDQCAEEIPIGFEFTYYGNTYTEVYPTTNGVVGFNSCNDEYFNDFSPLDSSITENIPSNTLFPFWDDLETNNSSNIFYATIGDEGSRKFIVQWTNHYSLFQNNDDFYVGPPIGTFQVILYEETGNIAFQYIDMKLGHYGKGMLATIGLTGNIDEDTEEYVQYSHLEELITDSNFRIDFNSGLYEVSTTTELEEIYLNDGSLPDSDMFAWYEFSEEGDLSDNLNIQEDLVVSGDPINYANSGSQNLPLIYSSGTTSYLSNNVFSGFGTGNIQISVPFLPETLPAEGNRAVLLHLGEGGMNLRVSFVINDDGTITMTTNPGSDFETITTTGTVNLETLNFITAKYNIFEATWYLYLNDIYEGATNPYEVSFDFSSTDNLNVALGGGSLGGTVEAMDGGIGPIGIWNALTSQEYLSEVYNEGNIRSYKYLFADNDTTIFPTFKWYDFTGADSYQLIISTDPSFESGTEDSDDLSGVNSRIVFQADGITDNYFEFEEGSPLNEGETYYWMVVAKYDNGEAGDAIQTSAVSSFTVDTNADFSGNGSGLELDPFLISTCSDLMEINDLLYGNYYFELTSDLDCSAQESDIIIGSENMPFTGTFEGGYHTVNIDVEDESYVGLFAKIQNSTISNLTVTGNVTGVKAGAIVGVALESTLSNLTAGTGTIVEGTGIIGNEEVQQIEDNVGGIVGKLYYSDLLDSFSNATVTGVYENIGGAVGHAARSEISGSSANSVVEGVYDVGGFAGDIDLSSVENSYSDGQVYGEYYVGGFVGDTNTFAYYNRVYSEATVTGVSSDIGGLVGAADDFVNFDQVYATGDVTGESEMLYISEEDIQNFYTGGLIGSISNRVSIENAYAFGDVSGDVAGGLIGQVFGFETQQNSIVNTYSKGLVSGNGEAATIGGLIAEIEGENNVESSFWDVVTSEASESAAGEGLETSDIKTQSTYSEAGWNFTDIWTMDSEKILNAGYPYFSWQESVPEFEPVTSTRSRSSSGSKAVKYADASYEEEIEAVLQRGIITKEPTNGMNKCEALMMLSRAFQWNIQSSGNSNYTDVPDWCVSVAEYGTKRGVVEGRTPSTLGLETPVTRYEVATMLYRELKVRQFEFKGDVTMDFTDKLVPWANEAVVNLSKSGIIKGFADGKFAGEKGILKQDFGVMLLRVIRS